MKTIKLICTVLMSLSIGITCSARDSEAKINIQNVGHHGDHNEYYDPADMPEVYYNSDLQEIIIYADGYASFYDVDIISQSTMQLVLYTTISGYGDDIDISALSDDNYTIVITSSNNNQYVGQFTNY